MQLATLTDLYFLFVKKAVSFIETVSYTTSFHLFGGDDLHI